MASTSLILHMLIKLKSICKTFMLLYVALFAVPTANCQPNQNCSIIYAAIHWTLILSTLRVGDSGKWPENRKRNIWTPLMHFDPEFELSFAAWTKSCEWADDDLLSHLLGNCLCCQLGISHEYKVYTVNLIQLHLLLQTYMTLKSIQIVGKLKVVYFILCFQQGSVCQIIDELLWFGRFSTN